MIIDLILDRKDGYRYNAHEFYGEVHSLTAIRVTKNGKVSYGRTVKY